MRFGKFEVIEELGRGAMGVIYRARDPHIDRLVAVKALTPDAARNETRRQRFAQEARIAGQLSHENIVKVYDFGEEGGVPYLAMELMEGTDLRTIIKDRIELLADKKLQILLQIARALHYAHKRGVVHRDVKPENVRLLEDGTVKIMDFGLALRFDEKDEGGGGLHGTIAYMAPERLEGREATPASDLWALGVLAYELLTFHSPFPADNYAAMMESITAGRPIPFDKHRVLVHPRLRDMVFRLLERDPARRHRSAGEVVEDIEEFVSKDATRRKEAQVAFEKALQSYRSGAFKAAITGWEETLRLEPDHFPARSHLKMAREKEASHREVKLLAKLAALYVEREAPQKALRYYQEVLRVDPHHAEAQEGVRVLGGLGDLAPAPATPPPAHVKTRSLGLPAVPPNASADIRRALGLVRREKLAEGVAILRDVLARSPRDTLAQDYLLRIVKRIRKRVLAEKTLVQSYIEKGNASFKTERFQEAEEAWNKVLSLDEGNLVARRNIEVLSTYLREPRGEEDIAYPEGQRFHARLPVNLPMRYRGLFSAKPAFRDGTLHRLSISGMSLLVDEPIPISAILELSLVLPGSTAAVELLGQVVHAVAEPFGRHLVGTILLLVPEAYIEYVKEPA